jgi:hypothetical protein
MMGELIQLVLALGCAVQEFNQFLESLEMKE